MSNKEQLSKEGIIELLQSPWEKLDARNLNPLVLAYIGDTVYEQSIRKYLIQTQGGLVNKLHKNAVRFVKAQAQSTIIHHLLGDLTQEEISIVKRGRNAKSGTTPKNANLSDYRYATGYEALIGYLYLIGDQERLMLIIAKSIELLESQEERLNTKENVDEEDERPKQ